ncbi:MAG: hypothetical protein ACI9NC_003869, partial [Verrucomicrobiales bacterium]
DADVRRAALGALGRQRTTPEGVRVLTGAFNDEEGEVVLSAIAALKALEEIPATPSSPKVPGVAEAEQLMTLLENRSVMGAAASALAKILPGDSPLILEARNRFRVELDHQVETLGGIDVYPYKVLGGFEEAGQYAEFLAESISAQVSRHRTVSASLLDAAKAHVRNEPRMLDGPQVEALLVALRQVIGLDEPPVKVFFVLRSMGRHAQPILPDLEKLLASDQGEPEFACEIRYAIKRIRAPK